MIHKGPPAELILSVAFALRTGELISIFIIQIVMRVIRRYGTEAVKYQ